MVAELVRRTHGNVRLDPSTRITKAMEALVEKEDGKKNGEGVLGVRLQSFFFHEGPFVPGDRRRREARDLC